jgi:transposase
LNDVFGEKRKRIPEEARQVLDVLENPSIDKAFDEATFKQYESSKYTYGVTLDYYNEYLKDKLSTHLE